MSFDIFILSYLLNSIILLQVFSSAIKLNQYVGDEGRNISLPCNTNSTTIMWLKEDSQGYDIKPMLQNGSLMFIDLVENDAGIYTCYITVSSDNYRDLLNNTNSNINTNNNYNYNYNKNDIKNNNSITNDNEESKNSLIEFYKARLKVRTPPKSVSYMNARVTTIVGVLMWKFFPNNTGGYTVRSFTAEFRKMAEFDETPSEWIRLDPTYIAPNARQLEIFGLKPNTSYEFRMWANNYLGAGEITITSVTTLSQMEEKDLIRLIMVDAKNFDTRVWIIAVGIVMGTLLLLSIGTSILLCKECRETTVVYKDDLYRELVPNIILNPGFCENDDEQQRRLQSPQNTIIYEEYYSDEEEMSFRQKCVYFFTGDSIKRL